MLPGFNVVALNLGLKGCCAAALDTLVTSITHKTLENLTLGGITQTPAAFKALAQSLPEMSSLQELELTGFDGRILQAKEMEALFGGITKPMPLVKLTFRSFNMTGCLTPLIKCLPFFPYLRDLQLQKLNIDEHDQCSLLKSFRFLTKLKVRLHKDTCLNSFHYCKKYHDMTQAVGVISLTPAAVPMLGRLLPEMSSLQVLKLIGVDGSILQAMEIEALFGRFNKMWHLRTLICRGFNARGCLAPLFRSLQFFPNLVQLELVLLNMDEHDLPGLLESFPFIPNLQKLNLSGNPLGDAVTCIAPYVTNLKTLHYDDELQDDDDDDNYDDNDYDNDDDDDYDDDSDDDDYEMIMATILKSMMTT